MRFLMIRIAGVGGSYGAYVMESVDNTQLLVKHTIAEDLPSISDAEIAAEEYRLSHPEIKFED